MGNRSSAASSPSTTSPTKPHHPYASSPSFRNSQKSNALSSLSSFSSSSLSLSPPSKSSSSSTSSLCFSSLLLTPLTHFLRPSQLLTLSEYFTIRHYPSGSDLFHQHTKTDFGSYYFVIEGEVEIFHNGEFVATIVKGAPIQGGMLTMNVWSKLGITPNNNNINPHGNGIGPPSVLVNNNSLHSQVVDYHVVTATASHHYKVTKCLFLSCQKLNEFIERNIHSLLEDHRNSNNNVGNVNENKSSLGSSLSLSSSSSSPPTLSSLLSLYPTSPLRSLSYLLSPSSILSSLPLFRGISSHQLHLLSYMMKLIYTPQHSVLFHEGSVGNTLYVVVQGELHAYVESSGKILHIFHSSDLFGEIACVLSVPRTASIKATQHSSVLELPRSSYQRFVKFLPPQVELHSIMKARAAEHFRKYKTPFFEAITDDKYIILASMCHIEQAAKGDIIFKQGDKANKFYIIAYGEVEIWGRRAGESNPNNTNNLPNDPTNRKDSSSTDESNTVGTMSKIGKVSKQKSLRGVISGKDAKENKENNNEENSSTQDPHGASDYPPTPTLLPPPTPSIPFIDITTSPSSSPPLSNSLPPLPSSPPPPFHDILLSRLPPGSYFGEMGIMDSLALASLRGRRTASARATSRCVFLTISKSSFIDFFNLAPESVADFEIKLSRYAISLRSLLYHPLGLQYFKKHLEREYSSENILFWMACRDFRNENWSRANKEYKMEEMRIVEGRESREGMINIQNICMEICQSITFTPSIELRSTNDLKAAFSIYSTWNSPLNTFTITIADLQDVFVLFGMSNYADDESIDELAIQMGETDGEIKQEQFVKFIVTTVKLCCGNQGNTFSFTWTHFLTLKLFSLSVLSRLGHFRRAFDIADLDESGYLELTEFAAVLRSMNTNFSTDDCQREFSMLDIQGSGQVNFERFIQFYLQHIQQMKIFQHHLVRKAGKITEEYVSDSAKNQVNLKGPTQRDIERKWEEAKEHLRKMERIQESDNEKDTNPNLPPTIIPLNLFDRAEAEIIKLMSEDPFNRFKSSDYFQLFIEESKVYKDPLIKAAMEMNYQQKEREMMRMEMEMEREIQLEMGEGEEEKQAVGALANNNRNSGLQKSASYQGSSDGIGGTASASSSSTSSTSSSSSLSTDSHPHGLVRSHSLGLSNRELANRQMQIPASSASFGAFDAMIGVK